MGIAFLLIAILLLMLGRKLVETNNQGHYQVKQAFISGKMTARMSPGTYGQWLGNVDTYRAVATVGFGSQKGEGSADINAIPVMFSDGSKADISGLVRIKLPKTEDGMIALKKEYSGGYDHFIRAGVVPVIENAVKLSANLRSAQDAYTTIAIFQQAIDDQLENGIYLTKSELQIIENAAGEKEERQMTVVLRDSLGIPLRKTNRLQEINCEVAECVIDVPNFDPKVEEMISLRKDEAMKTELAKQAALRAKQDALTAEQQGLANVATAKYKKEVELIEATTKAREKYEVAQFEAKEALEQKKATIAKGQADAESNRLKVAAGLSPQERAEWDYKTKVGVAAELAKVNVPSIVMSGGDGKSGANPMSAIGVNMLLDIQKKMNKK